MKYVYICFKERERKLSIRVKPANANIQLVQKTHKSKQSIWVLPQVFSISKFQSMLSRQKSASLENIFLRLKICPNRRFYNSCLTLQHLLSAAKHPWRNLLPNTLQTSKRCLMKISERLTNSSKHRVRPPNTHTESLCAELNW